MTGGEVREPDECRDDGPDPTEDPIVYLLDLREDDG